MMIFTQGPSLTELRKKLGTGGSVRFGDRDTDLVTVDALCVATYRDFPVWLPGHDEGASTWYINGDYLGAEDHPNGIVLATFRSSGRMICAVLVLAGDDGQSERTSAIGQLSRAFKELCASAFNDDSD